MAEWGYVDEERLTGALLRVDLYESRYLAVAEYHGVVNHLVRSAAAAVLLGREADALALVERAGRRMEEWVTATAAGRCKRTSYSDFAATRGLLVLALAPDARASAVYNTARSFLAQTADAPAGAVHNARLAAASIVEDRPALLAAANACELSDIGLGLPWKRFAMAVDARDEALATKQARIWLREVHDATRTNEWGAYNDVPVEVSGALALAARRGLSIRLPSQRVLPAFRAPTE